MAGGYFRPDAIPAQDDDPHDNLESG